jgi:signal peptidase I
MSASSSNPHEPRKESLRDTMESIVFAFILAFLFRTFEAEAFVIPPGSMAPTLYGRHKEADCVQCGTHIVVGASDEYDADNGIMITGTRTRSALCPSCRFENKQLLDALAFNGDRILVNKFPYEIGDPHRWDVFVFKYPEEPDMNYIKRLVGLPGETIRIRQGDVYKWDGKEEQILRKSNPNKQRALQMTVYDDAHPPTALLAAGWPERWAAVTPSPAGIGGWEETKTGWNYSSTGRVFRLDSKAPKGLNWVRYRHLVPHPGDWDQLEAKQPLEPRAELIGDFCGYNATTMIGARHHHDARTADQVDLGSFWVGDLTVNFTVDIAESNPNGEVVIELCEGVYIYRCHLELAAGIAKLTEINQALDATQEKPIAEGKIAMNSNSSFEISFANVDDRLCLWINDKLVEFEGTTELTRSGATGLALPQKTDLSPVGIAAQGIEAIVRDLRVERDVYYRAKSDQISSIERELGRRVDDPDLWSRYYQENADNDQQEIKVDADGFLALGDNSPRSRDSREWREDMQSVPRGHLVGRAFYIYWPHGVPFLNDGRGFAIWPHKEKVLDKNGEPIMQSDWEYPKWTVPFYPQVGRMKRIR